MNKFMNLKYTMAGGDLSHHNYGKVDPTQWSFVILKASEGKTFVDPKMNDYIADISAQAAFTTPYIGFYHYCHAESNTPHEEAQHFLKTVEHHLTRCMLALDVEGDAILMEANRIDAWCMQFCTEVQEYTGTIPLIYTSAAFTSKLPMSLKRYPLWIAHYGKKCPGDGYSTDINPIMWQFTDKPFDVDIFYGTPIDIANLVDGTFKMEE